MTARTLAAIRRLAAAVLLLWSSSCSQFVQYTDELSDPRSGRTLFVRAPAVLGGTSGFAWGSGQSGFGASASTAKPLFGAGAAGGSTSDDGLLAFRAPTDGVFYSRAAPDVPPFVSVGQRIQRGQPVGLIEVMKTFNQILYDGDSLPEQGTVKEIRVSDGEEVSAGQALIVVE